MHHTRHTAHPSPHRRCRHGVLVVVNLFVPARFRWREELARLSLMNRQIFQVHTIFIVLTLALFSALLLTSRRRAARADAAQPRWSWPG